MGQEDPLLKVQSDIRGRLPRSEQDYEDVVDRAIIGRNHTILPRGNIQRQVSFEPISVIKAAHIRLRFILPTV